MPEEEIKTDTQNNSQSVQPQNTPDNERNPVNLNNQKNTKERTWGEATSDFFSNIADSAANGARPLALLGSAAQAAMNTDAFQAKKRMLASHAYGQAAKDDAVISLRQNAWDAVINNEHKSFDSRMSTNPEFQNLSLNMQDDFRNSPEYRNKQNFYVAARLYRNSMTDERYKDVLSHYLNKSGMTLERDQNGNEFLSDQNGHSVQVNLDTAEKVNANLNEKFSAEIQNRIALANTHGQVLPTVVSKAVQRAGTAFNGSTTNAMNSFQKFFTSNYSEKQRNDYLLMHGYDMYYSDNTLTKEEKQNLIIQAGEVVRRNGGSIQTDQRTGDIFVQTDPYTSIPLKDYIENIRKNNTIDADWDRLTKGMVEERNKVAIRQLDESLKVQNKNKEDFYNKQQKIKNASSGKNAYGSPASAKEQIAANDSAYGSYVIKNNNLENAAQNILNSAVTNKNKKIKSVEDVNTVIGLAYQAAESEFQNTGSWQKANDIWMERMKSAGIPENDIPDIFRNEIDSEEEQTENRDILQKERELNSAYSKKIEEEDIFEILKNSGHNFGIDTEIRKKLGIQRAARNLADSQRTARDNRARRENRKANAKKHRSTMMKRAEEFKNRNKQEKSK